MAESNQNLSKGLVIAQLMQQQQQLTLLELTRLSSFSKQSVLRCLTTFIDHGWLRKRINDGRYIWTGIPHSKDQNQIEKMADKCMPVLQSLSKATGHAADLALANKAATLCIVDSTRTKAVGGVNLCIAGYQPSLVMTALGRAYLLAHTPAFVDRKLREVAQSLDLTERNCLGSARWLQEKNRFKKLGYSVRHYEDYIPQLLTDSVPSLAIALPLLQGVQPIGAINLVWDDKDLSIEQFVEQHLNALSGSVEKIQQLLT
jgi:DNA-binding IclR family transcriptional regulator